MGRLGIGCLLLIALLPFQNFTAATITHRNPSVKNKLWYQLSTGSQIATDQKFVYSAKNIEKTSSTLANVGVYMITRRLWDNNEMRQLFLSKIAPVLRQHNITLAINTTGAVWLTCRDAAGISRQIQSELNVMEAIERSSGLRVSHLALQSVLSKPLPRKKVNGVSVIDTTSLPGCSSDADLSLQDRVHGVVAYVDFFKKKKPRVQVGIIDALLAIESSRSGDVMYQDAYSMLYRRLKDRNLSLGFVLVDHPIEYLNRGSSLRELNKLSNFLKYRNIPAGLIITAEIEKPIFDNTGNDISMDVFQKRSKTYLRSVLNEGLEFDFYVQASWYASINKDTPQLSLINSFAEILSEHQ